MTNLKRYFKKFGEITFLVISISLFLQGCVASPAAKRSTVKSASTTTNPTNTKLPTFTDGNNFIQNGVTVSTAIINLDMNFSDFLQLRGKDVDSYIRNTGTGTVACLTSRFPSANKIIILAAIPRSVYSFTTQTLEYYYSLAPSDATTNQSFCQKTGLINQLFTYYPTFTPKYNLSEICPSATCTSSSYTGLALELYNINGVALTQIATKQLLFNLAVTSSGTTPVGATCTDSTTCKAQGYDCCSLGQCVKDLSLKPGVVTTSTDYLQALQDILNNPSNIYLYSQYYFICSAPVVTPTTPVTPTNPESAAALRLKKLTDLYNCTTKTEGEYGLCTKNYPSATLNTFYSAGKDDRSFADTFTNISVDTQTLVSVEQILYGDVVVYDYTLKDDSALYSNVYEDTSVRIEGAHNDDLASGTAIKVKVKPSAAVSDNLVIRYKVDVSCTKVNSSLAKCEKYYIQGQQNSGDTTALHRRGRVTDHFPDSNIFKLPYYANTSKAITVEVDGILQKQDSDWQLNIGAPSTVQFLPATILKVFKDQKVKLSYFVDLTINDVMSSKLAAQSEIKTICSCSETNCSLNPVKNTAGVVTDYACVFPDPDPVVPPVSQKIYLSSKTVPVRYFDKNGVSQSTVTSSSAAQEGIPFSYRGDNLLNPSNVTDITNLANTSDTYTGFNEIYGSISYTNNSAKPAYEVPVKKGSTYDIYVDRGAFSNCIQCGNDYYSQLSKLFPLTQFGGGAVPMLGQTNRTMTNGIRSDDLNFGRACMVPATMLPWSHNPESSGQTQRLNRMRAQHFLFANGYQKDWYGFDYGSVIGSFDGVRWFSIGSSRRIKAETTKMFIAVNGLFGDLTLESTYEVTINDGSLNPTGSNMNTLDYTSDGAECQQFHVCKTDNDCASTLGWDYACAPVSELQTSWPKFDDNAKEIPEGSRDNTMLTSILGISTSEKRCVYRGRGALCSPSYASVNETTVFNKTKTPAFHACSANTYCQTVATNGAAAAKFNNRIVRYGKVRTDNTVDSFGLAALIPGRPYAWSAIETTRAETLRNLNANKVQALCLPGRDLDQATFVSENSAIPPAAAEYNGDKVLGMGMSLRKSTPAGSLKYLASCSIEDSTFNYYHNTTANASADLNNIAATIPMLRYDSGSQAISTNALAAFDSIFNAKGINFGLYKNNSALLTTPSFTENRCMRAPGASCYTDIDCAPSKLLSDKIKSLSTADTTVTAILNAYEVKFWQEELVCSQAIDKTSNLYDPKNNRCCRNTGGIISLPSADNSNGLDLTKVPGIDYKMTTQLRYSRAATMYKEVNTDSTTYPTLRTAVKDQCITTAAVAGPGSCELATNLPNQFKTFAAYAEKTSCSGDWIRNFATGTNNHKWTPTNFQAFNATTFRCMNWYPGTGGYTCTNDVDDPNCGIAQTSPNTPKARDIFAYLGKMELMGIPQIALESEAFFGGTNEEGMSCKSHPTDRTFAYPDNPASPGTNYSAPTALFPTTKSPTEYYDVTKGRMYSALDASNFNGMKQIFKPDEVVSCLPAGTQMKAGDDPGLCCTGMINSANLKCQLADYIDLSVYTNRYVSSEAKKLSPTLFDTNGYIRDPAYAANLACEKKMCASGVVTYGILISRLKTPGQTSSDTKNYRFLEGNSTVDDENGLLALFNKGLKINTHAYCLPTSVAQNSNATKDLTVVTCGSSTN
ncbi:MAG: hypothetical protein H7336_13955 [Bacteriovorax sp.]|nr:hypothetical protein [Bacteriovorax sp.]